jgi:hypothetical protein
MEFSQIFKVSPCSPRTRNSVDLSGAQEAGYPLLCIDASIFLFYKDLRYSQELFRGQIPVGNMRI